MIVKLATVLLLAVLLAAPAAAQIVSGNTITGKVRDADGKALANIILELHTGNGMMFAQMVSDNEGNYTFRGLEAGSFVLVINEPYHQPYSERIELARMAVGTPGETVRVDVTLVPKNNSPQPRAGTVSPGVPTAM